MKIAILLFMSAWEIVIIVVIILLLFGGRKIPELMKGIGQGMKEFKNATKDDKEENKKSSIEKNNTNDK